MSIDAVRGRDTARILLVLGVAAAMHGPTRVGASEAEGDGPRTTVRLLNVGNSFSQNATRYLGDLAKAGGKVLVHHQASIGGGTLAQHWEKILRHADDPEDRRGLYSTRRSLEEELGAEPWDYVTIQQASVLSHDVSTYRPYARQ